MKKFFSFAAVAVAMFALTACGNSSVKDVYEDAASKLENAESVEEVAKIEADLQQEVAEIMEGMTKEEMEKAGDEAKEAIKKYYKAKNKAQD